MIIFYLLPIALFFYPIVPVKAFSIFNFYGSPKIHSAIIKDVPYYFKYNKQLITDSVSFIDFCNDSASYFIRQNESSLLNISSASNIFLNSGSIFLIKNHKKNSHQPFHVKTQVMEIINFEKTIFIDVRKNGNARIVSISGNTTIQNSISSISKLPLSEQKNSKIIIQVQAFLASHQTIIPPGYFLEISQKDEEGFLANTGLKEVLSNYSLPIDRQYSKNAFEKIILPELKKLIKKNKMKKQDKKIEHFFKKTIRTVHRTYSNNFKNLSGLELLKIKIEQLEKKMDSIEKSMQKK